MTKPTNHRRQYEAGGLALVVLFLLCPAAALASPTYYVDGNSGDDARTAAQAANPATPWQTIKKAVSAGGLIGMTSKGVVLDGYTVSVAPGMYVESVAANAVGLGNLTAFSDKYPDAGRVDLGYHGTLLYPSQGTAIISNASLTFGPDGTVGFVLSATLQPGVGTDGMNPGTDYAEVIFGDLDFPLWAGLQAGQVFSSNGGAVSARLVKLGDGSVSFHVQATGLSLSTVKFPTSVSLRVGDDVGSTSVLHQGNLQVK